MVWKTYAYRKSKSFLTFWIIVTLFIAFPKCALAQEGHESQEIPKVLLSLNEIKDFTFHGVRNFEVTTSNVIDVQNLPGDILRIKAIGVGSTFVYVWDSKERTTIQIEVTGVAPNLLGNLRPGYDPKGTEYIYHTTMANQYANGGWISPFWSHEFSSSIPIQEKHDWRTLLHATTNTNNFNDSPQYSPFSGSTTMDQILSYYQTPRYTVAVGDVTYNAGELSIVNFPLRGGSVQLYSPDDTNQFQVFGGQNRPQLRTNSLFNDPASQFVGVVGSEEILPSIFLKSSFVYLDQPAFNINLPEQQFQSDYVADVAIQSHPLTDKISLEGEYGKSRDDNAYRGLMEYTPYWGRILVSYRQIGKDYVTPSTFYLLKNYRETNFFTEVEATRKLGFNFDYQFSQFGADPTVGVEKTDVHSFTANSLFQSDDTTTYLASVSVIRSESTTNPQNYDRAYLTYQHVFKETNNQVYAQIFGQHSETNFAAQVTKRYGGGLDVRYTKNFSKALQLYLQNTFQMNQVNTTMLTFSNSPEYIETVFSVGPTVSYIRNKGTYSGGMYVNVTAQDLFTETSTLVQPFLSAYYNSSQALSLGTRINYNIDVANDYSYLTVIGELVYRFGTKVPDTILSTFVPSAVISGVVFMDANSDGIYQESEKLVPTCTSQLNNQDPQTSPDGTFTYKVDAGRNTISVQLPAQYQNYQFSTANPNTIDLFSRENKTLYFGISQRIALYGSVALYKDTKTKETAGFEGARVEIRGPNNYKNVIETPSSGIFNIFLPEAGLYHVRLLDIELPAGYKSREPTSVDVVVKGGIVNRVHPFTLDGKRMLIGRTFFDNNLNGIFDEDDQPAVNVKIGIGDTWIESDTDGTFAISPIPVGTYYIKAQPQNLHGYHLNLMTDKIIVPEVGIVELVIPYQK